MDEIKKGVEVHGVVNKDFEIKEDMLENLYEFCKAFGIEDLYEKANIQKPDHSANSGKTLQETGDEEEDYQETSPEEIAKARVEYMGAYLEKSKDDVKIYFKYDATQVPLMNQIHNIIQKNPGNCEVLAIKEDGIYTTHMYTSQKVFPQILQVCLSWKNLTNKRRGTA